MTVVNRFNRRAYVEVEYLDGAFDYAHDVFDEGTTVAAWRSADGLDVAFDVGDDASDPAAPQTVSLYNVAESTVEFMSAQAAPDQPSRSTFRLYAGYRDATSLIVTAGVKHVNVVRDDEFGPTTQMRVLLERAPALVESRRTTRDVVTAQWQYSDVSARHVFVDVAKRMGYPVAYAENVPDERISIYQNGSASDVLTDVLRGVSNDLSWSSFNGAVVVHDRRFLDEYAETLAARDPIAEGTGLIGVAYRTESGVEFSTFLDPQRRVGDLVSVKSGNIDGLFKIVKARHVGRLFGERWRTEFEAVG